MGLWAVARGQKCTFRGFTDTVWCTRAPSRIRLAHRYFSPPRATTFIGSGRARGEGGAGREIVMVMVTYSARVRSHQSHRLVGGAVILDVAKTSAVPAILFSLEKLEWLVRIIILT